MTRSIIMTLQSECQFGFMSQFVETEIEMSSGSVFLSLLTECTCLMRFAGVFRLVNQSYIESRIGI